MRVELVYARDCPLAAETRALLRRCLDRLGVQAAVAEIRGDWPSPTVLVDGIDVMGPPAVLGSSCRLDAPTEDAIVAALDRVRGPGNSRNGSEETDG